MLTRYWKGKKRTLRWQKKQLQAAATALRAAETKRSWRLAWFIYFIELFIFGILWWNLLFCLNFIYFVLLEVGVFKRNSEAWRKSFTKLKIKGRAGISELRGGALGPPRTSSDRSRALHQPLTSPCQGLEHWQVQCRDTSNGSQPWLSLELPWEY